MDLPNITGQPLWAQVIFVLAAAIVYIVVHLGVRQGKRTPPDKRSDTNEIVALTIDSRAIDRLTGEIAGLAVALHELIDAAHKLNETTGRQADATKVLSDELREASREVRALAREIDKARP